MNKAERQQEAPRDERELRSNSAVERIVSLWPRATWFIGMLCLGAGFVHGILLDDYSRGTFDLVIAIGCLYASDRATN